MPHRLTRKDSFSDDMILPLEGHGLFCGAEDNTTTTRLQSFGEDFGHYLSDADSDSQSSSQSEVDPYDRPIYAYGAPYSDPPYCPPPITGSFRPLDSLQTFEASAPISNTLLAPESLPDSPTAERPRATRARINYRELDSDVESDGNGTEDEYRPSPPPKRRGATATSRATRSTGRARRHFYSSASSSNTSSVSPSPSSSSSPLPRSHVNTRFTSRNRLVNAPIPKKLLEDDAKMICPVEGCGWFQRNRRAPDLRRHINTHFRDGREEKWICCGYLEDIADRLGVRGLLVLQIDGVRRRGGCGREFSRRDALKRHYDNPNIPCSGDVDTSVVRAHQV